MTAMENRPSEAKSTLIPHGKHDDRRQRTFRPDAMRRRKAENLEQGRGVEDGTPRSQLSLPALASAARPKSQDAPYETV